MTLTITIEMDNAAFDPEPNPETARILRKYATLISELRTIPDYKQLIDINGNSVGEAKVTE